MRTYILAVFGLLLTAQVAAQFTGGDADGSALGADTTILNQQDFYCNGGDADGYSTVSILDVMNTQDFYCSGGYYDGYAMYSRSTTMNNQYAYCRGGQGDGYALEYYIGTPFGEAIFAFGGNADGFSMASYSGNVFGPSLFCYGGNSDGFGMAVGTSLYLGVGLWTGLSGTEWGTNTNWQHDIVPGIGDNVIIPAGCPNYPAITSTLGIDTTQGFFECHGIEIQENATFTTDAPFYINGEFTLGGTYVGTLNANNGNRVYHRGSLSITSTGSMILGNQTTLWGFTDLDVYDGGLLSLDGGILHIDDQLHIYSGGTLNMTSGELFVHEFGQGTVYFASNPANFYIESGANGGISGGTLRICGRESNSGLHALTILEPTFDFTGTSTISFEHGDYATHFDCGINVVDGVELNNLIINKPGNTVFFNSNAQINGDVTIEAGATLDIETGRTITLGP